MGPVGAAPHSSPADSRPRVLRHGRGRGRRSDQRQARRLRLRRNARGLRQVPAMPHRRGAHLPAREDHRRGRQRRLRRVRRHSRVEYLEARSFHPAGVRVHPRSAGQRGAHRAGRRHRRQKRGHHRLRPHRAVLHRGGARLRSHPDLRARGERASPQDRPADEARLRPRSHQGRRVPDRDGQHRRHRR